MTCGDVIRRTDRIKPNAYPEDVKLDWINELERRMQTEVFLYSPQELVAHAGPDEPVLGHEGFWDVYDSFLCAKVDLANGEYRKYVNSREVFGEAYRSYMKWYAETFAPAQTRR